MIRKQPYTFYVLFVFLFLIPFGKAFAGWNNFIVNFDKSLYGKGPQTWQIAPYDDHWVYFANKFNPSKLHNIISYISTYYKFADFY